MRREEEVEKEEENEAKPPPLAACRPRKRNCKTASCCLAGSVSCKAPRFKDVDALISEEVVSQTKSQRERKQGISIRLLQSSAARNF